MRINVAVPEAHVKPPVLNAALEATTKLNEALIKSGDVPTFSKALPSIQWKPEPPGDEHFDHAGVVVGRGWGDCDDLAPYHAASLRVTGKDPLARAVVKRSGPKRWHAIVRRGDGSIDDPSAAAGMHEYARRHGIVGAGLPIMWEPVHGVHGAYIRRPQLALRPVTSNLNAEPEAWQARADLPWHADQGDSPTDIAMVSLHASPVSSQAVVGACRGLVRLGEANGMPDEYLDRLDCVADACEGATWEDLAYHYGPEHATAAVQVVGGFFGGLGKLVKKAAGIAVNPLLAQAKMIPGVLKTAAPILRTALPIASKVLPFVPGVGPIASMALNAASPLLQSVLRSGGQTPPPQMMPPQMQMPQMMPQMQMPQMMPYGGGGMYAPPWAQFRGY